MAGRPFRKTIKQITMDEQSRATLDAILAQEPAALTEEDKAFLRARRSYLSTVQADRYEEVLSEVTTEEQTSPEVASEVTEQESSADESPAEDTSASKPKKASKKASVTE